jgi:hypothetical protein
MRVPDPAGVFSIDAQAVVVRTVADDPGSHLIPGVGVRFVDLDPAIEARIGRFVAQPAAKADEKMPRQSLGWRADAADRHGGG